MNLLRWTLAVAAVCAAQPAFAQGTQPMPGRRVQQRTAALMKKISWETSRETLQERAKASGKLVFWLQLVGKLYDGL